MSTDTTLRRALAALKPFADAYPQDGYLSPVRLIYSDGAKGSLAVEDFGEAHDTYEALTAADRLAPDTAASDLADELQKLCCAETESQFFDRVTDNIQTILAALRRKPPDTAAAVEAERILEAIVNLVGPDYEPSETLFGVAFCMARNALATLRKAGPA